MDLRSKLAAAAIGFGLAIASGPALAVTTNNYAYDFTGADWFSPDFVGTGSASWANDGGVSPPTRLRLTPSAPGQQGSAWLNTGTVEANQAWTANFDWQITFEGGGGADGLAFHLQEDGTGANPNFQGGGLSNPHLSVGIDTWNNGGELDFALEVNFNGVQIGGDVDLSGLGPVADHVWRMFLSYDGAGTLSVNVFDVNFGNQTFPQFYAVDLSALDQATLGWSANTGGSTENHDILAFNGEFVPEPGTALMLGAGLAGLGWLGRRRA